MHLYSPDKKLQCEPSHENGLSDAEEIHFLFLAVRVGLLELWQGGEDEHADGGHQEDGGEDDQTLGGGRRVWILKRVPDSTSQPGSEHPIELVWLLVLSQYFLV